MIGSGIAGLSYAIKSCTAFSGEEGNCYYKNACRWNQYEVRTGGIAGVWDEENDSFEKHIEDTLIAGDGLCNEAVVEIVVKEGPERIREIIEYGARFDKRCARRIFTGYGRRAASTAYCITKMLPAKGKWKGALLEEVYLLKCGNIEPLFCARHYYATSPWIPCNQINNRYHLLRRICAGPLTNKIEKILSGITLMASGGLRTGL